MTIQYYKDIVQGSDQWHKARCGLLTASRMSELITPTLKIADNKDSRAIVYEVMCERITGIVQDQYQSFDMLRGHEEEVYARQTYSENYEPVEEVGFVTNDKLGFVMGWSPDGLIGTKKGLQIKSRKNELQIKTIIEGVVPSENIIQIQSEIFIGELDSVEYVSYSNGLPMWTINVLPDPKVQDAIEKAATTFEETIKARLQEWDLLQNSGRRLIPTERREINNGEINA